MPKLPADISRAAKIFFDYSKNRTLFKYHKRIRQSRTSRMSANCFQNIGVLYIHVPRTAGTSVTRFLDAIDSAATARADQIEMPSTVATTTKHVKAIDAQILLGPQLFEQYHKIVVVRNPWDLMLSSYRWWCTYAHMSYDTIGPASILRNLSFPEFIDSIYGRYFINEHYGRVKDWYQDQQQDLVDDIIRYEHLRVDLQSALERAGLRVDTGALPNLNASAHTPYRDHYSAKARDIVYERHKDVIERFGYEF